ncbi:hypothetical protein PIB30_065734 [Stylosanthes scabra]|uniref:Uncharacterized protein n=1 Tax=Stylosanthes scabra TaxID=79078 RepID=A0ABU6SMG3_9FABA|nr:hypothetical protein [Stylosanthes scabra]
MLSLLVASLSVSLLNSHPRLPYHSLLLAAAAATAVSSGVASKRLATIPSRVSAWRSLPRHHALPFSLGSLRTAIHGSFSWVRSLLKYLLIQEHIRDAIQRLGWQSMDYEFNEPEGIIFAHSRVQCMRNLCMRNSLCGVSRNPCQREWCTATSASGNGVVLFPLFLCYTIPARTGCGNKTAPFPLALVAGHSTVGIPHALRPRGLSAAETVLYGWVDETVFTQLSVIPADSLPELRQEVRLTKDVASERDYVVAGPSDRLPL